MRSSNQLTIFCDGASRGNPGQSASAFVVIDENENIVYQEGKALGISTNNVAEYQAVIIALQWFTANFETSKLRNLETILINLDSQLLYSQIIGKYKIKAPHLKPLHQQILELMQKIKHQNIKLEFQHQLRQHNTIADQLANQILDHTAE